MSNHAKQILSKLSIVVAAALYALPASAYNYWSYPFSYPGYWIWPLTTNVLTLANPTVGYARAVAYPFGAMSGSSGSYHWINSGDPTASDMFYPHDVQYSRPYFYRNNTQQPGAATPCYNEPGAYSRASRTQSLASTKAQDESLINGANLPGNTNKPPLQALGVAPATVPSPGFIPAAAPIGAANLAGSPLNASLAKLFIDRINDRFKGNIKTALSDPDTKALAQALGLIESNSTTGANISNSRIALSKQIMADTTLSSASKLDAVRALIKQ